MSKLTLIFNQNKKAEELKSLADLNPLKFKQITSAPLPNDYLCMVVGNDSDQSNQKEEKTFKILALDPSGTGKTGICLIDQQITFREFPSPLWSKHLTHLMALIQAYQPTILLYESTNYINSRGKDMTSLFKLMGALEGLKYTFTFIKQIETIPVHQVKDLKAKLLKGVRQIPNLTFKKGRGKGWMFKGKRISLHQLDAYLVYYLWKERQRTCFESSEKEEKRG